MIYALRIDNSVAEVRAWLDKHNIGGFGVREVAGDNEHWHFLMQTDKTLKQLRPSLLRAVPTLCGNGAYSLTECRDVDKYERYMVKGESEGEGFELAWRHSITYTDEKLEELHAAYWADNQKLRKRKIGTMIDWVVDECKRQNIAFSDRNAISKLYIRELAARQKPINLFAVRASVNTVQVRLCPDDSMLDALIDSATQY